MAQSAPSTLLYSQALSLIEQFQQDYSENKFKTPEEISAGIKDVLTKFTKNAGTALTQYDPFLYSEPAQSKKVNRFWNEMQADVNIIQDQVDVLRSATVFLHNFITAEILKSKNENSRIQNKLTTLQLYTGAKDNSLIYFYDSFLSDDSIEWSLTPQTNRVARYGANNIGLGADTQRQDYMNTASVKILETSNGFLGNNQEIEDPMTATVDPVTKEKQYTFIAETNRAADLKALLDNQPSTWIEYENYLVSNIDRATAKNLNFSYRKTKEINSSTDVYSDNVKSALVDWAAGPSSGILKLDMEFDLGSLKPINFVSYSPFGLKDNINNPVKVREVKVSSDGTDWILLNPKDVWIASGLGFKALPSDSVVIGTAIWNNQQGQIRYIRMSIEQHNPIEANIGHLYYISERDGTVNTSLAATGNDAIAGNISTVAQPFNTNSTSRLEGPIPDITNPAQYYTMDKKIVNGLVQKREYFNGNRWVIGVKDIDVRSIDYKQRGFMITKNFRIPGIIDRVALEADIELPSDYPAGAAWVHFYVSPDNGSTWYEISRIQDDYLGVSEILAFNDPIPEAFRENGVAYYDVPGVVNSIRLKVELSRPSDKKNTTPILKSYKLKIKRRS